MRSGVTKGQGNWFESRTRIALGDVGVVRSLVYDVFYKWVRGVIDVMLQVGGSIVDVSPFTAGIR